VGKKGNRNRCCQPLLPKTGSLSGGGRHPTPSAERDGLCPPSHALVDLRGLDESSGLLRRTTERDRAASDQGALGLGAGETSLPPTSDSACATSLPRLSKLSPEGLDWQRDRACRAPAVDPEWFYPGPRTRAASGEQAELMKAEALLANLLAAEELDSHYQFLSQHA
jgi:hypothetical protein